MREYKNIEELDDARPQTYEEFRDLVYALCLDKKRGYLSGFPEDEAKKWLMDEEQEKSIRESYERCTDPSYYVPYVMNSSRSKEDAARRILNYKNGNYLRSAAGECAYAFSLMY